MIKKLIKKLKYFCLSSEGLKVKKQLIPPFSFIFVLLTFTLLSHESIALESMNRFKAEKLDVPKRSVSVIASKDGFYPDSIAAYIGEEVHFFVTSTTEQPTCFIVDGRNLFLSAKRGEISEGKVYFDQAETINFHCPTGGAKGKIVVMERPEEVRERIKREIAGQEKFKIWQPRDDEDLE